MKNYFKSKDGAIAIIVAISIIVLLGFGAFAVDMGFVYMKKNELQNAADAAALAGAAALVSYGDNLGQVKNVAMDYARRNFTVQNNPEDTIQIGDITFYKDYVLNSIDPNQVEATVRRIGARGNPVTLFLARALGLDVMDVTATARAEAYHPAGSRCLKPFTVPANFTWDDANGNKVCDLHPENQSEADSIQLIEDGKYTAMHIGTQMTLKWGNRSNDITPGQYQPIAFPPVPDSLKGADVYRENIHGCEGSNGIAVVNPGDLIDTEPGAMMGPTKQEIQYLIDRDPGAHWVGGIGGHIEGSQYEDPLASPRIGIIVIYDPTYDTPSPGRDDPLKVLELVGFFIEAINNQGEVTGRLMGAMAVNPGPGVGDDDSLLYAIRLIRDSTR